MISESHALLEFMFSTNSKFRADCVAFLEPILLPPKSATGKMQKEPLRQAGVTDRTWDRESVGYKIPRRV